MDWQGEIHPSMIPFNFPTMIFVIHLYNTLQRDMGLKSLRQEGLGILGTKHIKLELTTIGTRSE